MNIHKNTHTLHVRSNIGMCGGSSLILELIYLYAYKDSESDEKMIIQVCEGSERLSTEQGKHIGSAQCLSQRGTGVSLLFFEIKENFLRANPEQALKFIEQNELVSKVLRGEDIWQILKKASSSEACKIPESILTDLPLV